MAANHVTVPKTRKKTKCPVFGTQQQLSEIVLPTYESVMKYYLLVKHDLKSQQNNKDPSLTAIAEHVTANIERLCVNSYNITQTSVTDLQIIPR